MWNKNTTQVAFRCDDKLRNCLTEDALGNSRTLSDQVRFILRDFYGDLVRGDLSDDQQQQSSTSAESAQ